jgi:hypothetical protein
LNVHDKHQERCGMQYHYYHLDHSIHHITFYLRKIRHWNISPSSNEKALAILPISKRLHMIYFLHNHSLPAALQFFSIQCIWMEGEGRGWECLINFVCMSFKGDLIFYSPQFGKFRGGFYLYYNF